MEFEIGTVDLRWPFEPGNAKPASIKINRDMGVADFPGTGHLHFHFCMNRRGDVLDGRNERQIPLQLGGDETGYLGINLNPVFARELDNLEIQSPIRIRGHNPSRT